MTGTSSIRSVSTLEQLSSFPAINAKCEYC